LVPPPPVAQLQQPTNNLKQQPNFNNDTNAQVCYCV
jgi:hypothetical protein